MLPRINCLRIRKAEIVLNVLYTQPALLPQGLNLFACFSQIDGRKRLVPIYTAVPFQACNARGSGRFFAVYSVTSIRITLTMETSFS